jgi:hypothetical protein
LVEKWRLEHPHDTPLHPFMPSPTSGDISMGEAVPLLNSFSEF